MNSRPQPPSSNPEAVRTALTIVLGVLVCCFLCCGGVATIGGLFFVYSKQTVAKVQQAAANAVRAQPQGWENDWIVQAQLGPLYSSAVDTVIASKEVQEKLGTPIETSDADTLYHRERKGDIDLQDESLVFDIQGPRGKARVKVHGGLNTEIPQRQFSFTGMWPKSIKVTLDDGTEIDVPPLKPPAIENPPDAN